ncbi:MAG: hypothetical protein Q8N18_25030 [Opitutaceae bacterium]|nr:hypothetical protein [Opitutaceae bacterium]
MPPPGIFGEVARVASYPGKLGIPATPGLSPDEAEVERRFAAKVEAELEDLIAEYEAQHGPIIDPDRAREFCADYAASIEARGKYSQATYAPAKALTDAIFHRRIAQGPPGLVRFLSGGAGSGKSTVLAALGDKLPEAIIVVDGTLSRLAPAREKIDFCLAQGCEVEVLHLHRPFEEAVRAILARASSAGRRVEPEAAAATHHGAQTVLLALADLYGASIEIRAVFFSQDSGAEIIDLESLRSRYAHPPLDQMTATAKGIFENAGG